jgi:hypothetical protein
MFSQKVNCHRRNLFWEACVERGRSIDSWIPHFKEFRRRKNSIGILAWGKVRHMI